MKRVERSRIRTVQMDNLRGLLGISMMDKVLDARIKELYGATKGLMKVSSGGSVLWRECRIIGLLRGCMCGNLRAFEILQKKKKKFDIRQTSRMVCDRSEWLV